MAVTVGRWLLANVCSKYLYLLKVNYRCGHQTFLSLKAVSLNTIRYFYYRHVLNVNKILKITLLPILKQIITAAIKQV